MHKLHDSNVVVNFGGLDMKSILSHHTPPQSLPVFLLPSSGVFASLQINYKIKFKVSMYINIVDLILIFLLFYKQGQNNCTSFAWIL